MKKPCATSTPLCSPRSTPTWPFDVKPPTYEPIGLIPTRESSVLFEIILHQALKQTGETTRACRFCLQVLNFLQMEGRSAFYRKFLRISSIKDLWAMTRRHSRHSSRLKSQFSSLKSVFTPHFQILKSHPCLYSKGGLYVCLQKIFRLSGKGVGYP